MSDKKLYVAETGNDAAQGGQDAPLKSVIAALFIDEKAQIMVPGVGEGADPWVPIAKAQLKKQTKMFQAEKRKRESASKQAGEKEAKEKADAEARAKNMEEAKKVKLVEDVSLPKAKMIKIRDGRQYREQRVKINGWVHRLRFIKNIFLNII